MGQQKLIGSLGSLTLMAMAVATQAHAHDAFSATSPWMSGDWGGTRTDLIEKGYDFTIDYAGEAASNIGGGYNKSTTARYSDQFAFGMHLDLEKILGWSDAEFKLTVTERSGRSLSADRIGDPRAGQLSAVQEVYGRGQTWRLTQMWFKQQYFDKSLSVKFGRYGIGEDFGVAPCDFMNLALCGPQVANWAGDVWFNWPVSQWGMTVKYNFMPDLFLQVGAFEQNPSYLETGNAFKLSGSGTKGAIIPAEVVWSPKVNGLPGEYRLGYFYSTAKANDIYKDVNGQSQALTGNDFKRHSSKHSAWFSFQQQLTADSSDASRGLTLFASATIHDKAASSIDSSQQVGIVYKGLFDARPKDDIGLGMNRIHVNDDVRKRAEELNALNGVSDYDNPAFNPLRRTEYNAELYYGYKATNWLTLRPNLQYIKSPGGIHQVDDAVVAGLKVVASF